MTIVNYWHPDDLGACNDGCFGAPCRSCQPGCSFVDTCRKHLL